MRTLFLALGIIGATSADAAMQLPSATPEKPAVIAAAQRSASDLAQTGQTPTSCELQQPAGSILCNGEEAVVVASAPPRRPPRRTRRR